MNRFNGLFFHWLPLGAAIIGICGLLYVTVQQNYRQSLNDPQIQIAEDGARALASGKKPVDVVPRGTIINISEDLAPFIAIFDKDGNPLESSAIIDNALPKPPAGVFEHAKSYGENKVTWQPNSSTRIALVVRPVPDNSGWFVASGRNMREVEKREDDLTKMIGAGMVAVLILSFILDSAGDFWRRRAMSAAIYKNKVQ